MFFHKDFLFSNKISKIVSFAVYQGADIGECFEVSSKIHAQNKEQWHSEWRKLAEKCFQKGKDAEKRDFISAYQAFLRASHYFKASALFLPEEESQGKKTEEKSNQCLLNALKYTSDPFEIVKDENLSGYFFLGEENAPLFVSMGKSLIELYLSIAYPAALRKYHALILKENEKASPEKTAAFGIDFALRFEETNLEKVVLYGCSDITSLKASAIDTRIKACVFDDLRPNTFPSWISSISCPSLVFGREGKGIYDLLTCMKEHNFLTGLDRLKKDEKIFLWLNSLFSK